MFKKIFINIILILIVYFFSISFLSSFWPFTNLFLPLFVFVLMFFENRLAILWSCGAGFLLDVVSPLPFGSYLLFFCLTYLVLKYLNQNFFTNQSLNTFFALTLVDNIFLLIFLFLEKKILILFDNNFFIVFSFWQIATQLILTFLTCMVLFFTLRFFTNRLRLDLLPR
ncbi:MAG TPA: hypothetical protein PLH37_01915 [bacterium]|nr:hypothetical protein [bacterium]